ncbi:MAG TPA: response regulator [Rhizomicrobium sp.]|jgi:CheY-like chemotaxis protein|nr:response regulator [Rhizomicrobium sp.]
MDQIAHRHRVLLVEDEPLVAMMMEQILEDLGRNPTVASRVDDALSLAKTCDFDVAILDVHINGDFVFPIADVLAERGIPFLFATGRGEKDIPQSHRGRPLLTKPFPPEELVSVLDRLEYANVQAAFH